VSKGPICLGHIIPDLKHLDDVINTDGPEPYPPGMSPYQSQMEQLKWDISKEQGIDLSAKIEVPTGMLPVDPTADAGVVFKREIKNYWKFDKLDTTIIQPTVAYIDDSLEDPLVADFLSKKKGLGLSAWTLYMISGLIIARGAKGGEHTTSTSGGYGHAGAELTGLAAAKLGFDIDSSAKQNVKFGAGSDFIWAVRLTKISKGLFSRTWGKETFKEGATFNLGDDQADPLSTNEALAKEGLEMSDVVIYECGNQGAFVASRECTDTAESR
jgi:hypothetical protein